MPCVGSASRQWPAERATSVMAERCWLSERTVPAGVGLTGTGRLAWPRNDPPARDELVEAAATTGVRTAPSVWRGSGLRSLRQHGQATGHDSTNGLASL